MKRRTPRTPVFLEHLARVVKALERQAEALQLLAAAQAPPTAEGAVGNEIARRFVEDAYGPDPTILAEMLAVTTHDNQLLSDEVRRLRGLCEAHGIIVAQAPQEAP